MILQSIYGENDIFIDDEVLEKIFLSQSEVKKIYPELKDEEFTFHGISYFKVLFKEEEISITANRFHYNNEENYIIFILDNYEILKKQIQPNEIISISLSDDGIIITTFKLPVFMTRLENIEYPKFEISISDCIYNMKIYINNSEYIDIPNYQSHDTILNTIDHIKDVVNYISKDPLFIESLSDNKQMKLTVYNKERNYNECNIYEYKLSDYGIVLIDELFDNGYYLVEWQKFFRLVIDKIWEIDFD